MDIPKNVYQNPDGCLPDAASIRQDIWLDDRLHMNRTGYQIWNDALRPWLLEVAGAL